MASLKAGLASLPVDSAVEALTEVCAWLAGNATAVFVGVPVASTVLWYATSYVTSPLRKYPGPFLACRCRYPNLLEDPALICSNSVDQVLQDVPCLQRQHAPGHQEAP